MNTTDVLQMKLIDILNRPVKYMDTLTGRKRKARIYKVEECGAGVERRDGCVIWMFWEDLEWIE